MKRAQLAGLIVLLFACALKAQTSTTFTYTQTDAATGAGVIAGFTVGSPGGDIIFAATPMPGAVVSNPGAGIFVGKQTVAGGASNEPNSMAGLVWSGSVTATGTRGTDVYTVQIPLRFVPKVTQAPDTSDYNWLVSFGDDAAGGTDVVSTTQAPRFEMIFSRDDVIDAIETPNTFQRYTQQSNAFTTGQNTFTNTDLTTTTGTPPLPIPKDATDPPGAPAGTDAAGRNLAFYFGWRDQGVFAAGSPQVFLVDDFKVGGLLNPDMNTLVPEPGSLLSLGLIAMVGMIRRRKV